MNAYWEFNKDLLDHTDIHSNNEEDIKMNIMKEFNPVDVTGSLGVWGITVQ